MDDQLHVLFFPLQAFGHMIPIRDMAKLFASRGVKTTIITTPLSAHIFRKSVENSKVPGPEICLRLVKFQAAEAGLPEGFECLDQLISDEMAPKFAKATTMLQEPLEHLLQECRPDCLVADLFFPWATKSAAKFGIPRLVFHGTGFFALCVADQMQLYKPFLNISSDNEPFVVPNLPHEIKLTRRKMPPDNFEETETEFAKIFSQLKESEIKSYGAVVNSFYELEPDYADYYRNKIKMKAWHIGPVSLCNRGVEDKAQRGKKPAIGEEECLKWLDSKDPNLVLYVCFGSVAGFTDSQLCEIAMGLEASGHQFIWVVGKSEKEEVNEKEWMPGGFEERIRMGGNGLIIRGWAPQLLILEHESVGGFVTHCGWNSVLEAGSAGVPMVTWPVFAEQFYNEKLVTEILKTGIAVGSDKFNRVASDGVKMAAVEKAVRRIMAGEEAEELRRRANALKEKASKAVGEGGSSYLDLNDLIKKLSSQSLMKQSTEN